MATGTPITYQVTAVTPDTEFSGTSTPVKGKRVEFSTNTGYTGAVFVPAAVFADRVAVQRLIEGEVRMVAAAQAITGTIG